MMSKKMLKRSLALGALMAFVITGQVWAGNIYDGQIFTQDKIDGVSQSVIRDIIGTGSETIIFQGASDNNSAFYSAGNNNDPSSVLESQVTGLSKLELIGPWNPDAAGGQGEDIFWANKNTKITISDIGSIVSVNVDDSTQGTMTFNTCGGKIEIKDVGSIDVHDAGNIFVATQKGVIDAQAKNINVSTVGYSAIYATDVESEVLIQGDDTITIKSTGAEAIRAYKDSYVNIMGTPVDNGSYVEYNTDIVIDGGILADTGSRVVTLLNGNDSSLTGKVTTQNGANTQLLLYDGATWNVTGVSNLTTLDGKNGVVAIDEALLNGTTAVTIVSNNASKTTIKARGLDLSGGAREALSNVKQKLQSAVAVTDSSSAGTFSYANATDKAALYGDVVLDENDKLTTTLDTNDLIVNGDVKAESFNGLQLGMNENSIGIGDVTIDGGFFAVAIGEGAIAKYSAVAVGGSSDATGSNSTAVGFMAQAKNDNTVAVGYWTIAKHDNSVALGHNSETDSNDSVSIGYRTDNSGGKYTRKLQFVTAGEDDTDAVNVAQLNAGLAGKVDAGTVHDGAFGLGAPNSLAIGTGSEANLNNGVGFSTAVGINSKAVQSATAIGNNAKALYGNSVALGSGSVADRGDTVSVGIVGYERQITNVKAGTETTDAVNKGQLDNAVNELQTKITANSTAIGTLQENVNTNTEAINALKNNVNTNTEAIGSLQTGVATNKQAIEANAEAIEGLGDRVSANETVIAANTQAIKNNADAIAKETSERQAAIGDLNSRVDTVQNAINSVSENVVGQINEVAKSVETVKTDLESTNKQVATNAEDIATNKQAIEDEAKTRETKDNELLEKINQIGGGSSDAINTINQRLDRTNAKINKVGAGAAALAALHPLDYDPDDKLTFSAGVGNYAGENAAALGAFYRPNEKFMVSLGGTMGNGENMVNLGLSIGLDKANGLAKMSKRELIQEVNAVKAENEAIKADNEAMKAEMAEMKAMLQELLNKK